MFSINAIFIMLLILVVKHFFVDFIWQPEYEWRNKGKYGHWGGIRHSLKHSTISFAFLVNYIAWYDITLFTISTVTLALLVPFEFVIHYHADWVKVNLSSKFGWKPDSHPQFWELLGFDQLIHTLTYLLMIYFIVAV